MGIVWAPCVYIYTLGSQAHEHVAIQYGVAVRIIKTENTQKWARKRSHLLTKRVLTAFNLFIEVKRILYKQTKTARNMFLFHLMGKYRELQATMCKYILNGNKIQMGVNGMYEPSCKKSMCSMVIWV
ncbi:uncharacterized protein LOC114575265 [Exaiptasia diaphana]|uniref:Uncharacterized protein n=1 Tax=Exaiptasia diaphana TaxID=2652724 RepID=A0A913YKF0_EXADI|nr:uncharacterized protein LOC114575265 [Exaiptasia diaphana]